MPQRIKLPDGTVISVPDDATQDELVEIEAEISAMLAESDQTQPRRVGLAESVELIGRAARTPEPDLIQGIGESAVRTARGTPEAVARGAGQLLNLAQAAVAGIGKGAAELATDPVGAAESVASGSARLGKNIIQDPEAFARGIGSGAGGLGEAVEVGRQVLSGKRGREADIAAARVREEAQARSPGAFTAGQLAGGVALGGRAAVAGGPVRGSGTGAALAGGQASAEGGDVGEAIVAGGALGGSIPAAGRAIRSTGALTRIGSPNKAAARLLKDRLGLENVDEAEALLREAQERTGRRVSIAELLDEAEAGEAGRIAGSSKPASATARSQIERTDQARSTSLPKSVLGRRPEIVERQLDDARGAEFERAFDPIREKVISPDDIGAEAFETLDNAAKALPRELPGEFGFQTAVRAQKQLRAAREPAIKARASGDPEKIQRAMADLADADAVAKEFPITLDALDQARFDLGALGAPAASGGKKSTKAFNTAKLAKRVREIGVQSEPRYGKILDTFARRARRQEAAFGGGRSSDPANNLASRIASQRETTATISDALDSATGAGRSGARLGLVRELAKEAETIEGAKKVSLKIAASPSMQANIRKTLGNREADRIIGLAKIESASIKALNAASPRATSKAQVAAEQGSEFARIGFAGNTGGAGLAALTRELVDKFLVPPPVARRLAEDIFIPENAERAFAGVRKIVGSDEAFAEVMRNARAAIPTQAPSEPPELRE